MSEIFATIIGIAKYHDAFLAPALYAEEDARAVSAALVELGCPLHNQQLLINETATATAIDSDVGSMLEGLSQKDKCFIFFAGHGFSDGHQNYLAAHDTRSRDIEGTSIRLQRFLGYIKECKSKQIVLFLDACHSGIKTEDTMRSSVLGISDDEEFCACFASCRANQKSYSSRRLKRGIWSYHLVEALSGRAKEALTGDLLTASKLQAYLIDEVPRTIREEFSTPRAQTPRFFGSYEGITAIADLSTVLAKQKSESAANALNLKQVALVSTCETNIKSLRGFDKKKGHFIPDKINSAATGFVERLAKTELEEHITEKYNQIRSKMKIKIKDISVANHDGGATIRAPTFDYNVTASQSPADPGWVLWRYELVNISDASLLKNDAFNEIFRGTFNTVEFTFDGSVPNIRKLAIDLEDAGMDVECPIDFRSCSFTLDELNAEVIISADSVKFSFEGNQSPTALIDGFQAVYARLLEQPAIMPLLGP